MNCAAQDARSLMGFSMALVIAMTSTVVFVQIADGESVEMKKQKRAEWADALQFLVKLKAVQHKKPLPPPPQSTTSSAAAAAPPVPS